MTVSVESSVESDRVGFESFVALGSPVDLLALVTQSIRGTID